MKRDGNGEARGGKRKIKERNEIKRRNQERNKVWKKTNQYD